MVVSRERVEGHASMTCPDDLRQHLIIYAPLTHCHRVPPPRSTTERCFRAVDSMSDGSPTLIAIDEEPNHQDVHAFRLGKADRLTYQPLDRSCSVRDG